MDDLLNGVSVVELCSGIVGPLAGRWLAAHGATVVKVEDEGGDWTRSVAPQIAPSVSALFWACNAGKQSVTIPSDSPGGLSELVAGCALVLVDVGVDVARRVAELRAMNPSCMIVAISGRGDRSDDPRARMSEAVLQAESALLECLGRWVDGERPRMHGYDLASTWAASAVFRTAILGLFVSNPGEKGHSAIISELETVRSLQRMAIGAESDPEEPAYAMGRSAPFNPPMFGIPASDVPIGMFEFRPHGYLFDDELYAKFHAYLGLDPKWDTAAARDADRDVLNEAYKAAFARHTAGELLDAILRFGGKGAIMNSCETVFADPQIAAVGMPITDPADLRTVARPFTIAGMRNRTFPAAPLLGAQTAQYLKKP